VDISFTVQEREFREEVRTWLHDNVPTEPRPDSASRECRDFDMAWQRAQYDGGWAGIAWPAEYGGRGSSTVQQLIWHEEYAMADAPWIGSAFVGINHGGPTLIARATDEQKAFHLPRILRGESVWCQGFSEPGAGSDLAGLRCAGVIDGDELVVTGQKIWTSFAHVADWQELLVRTDPDAPKHKGITWVICDMSLPGIEVRQIPTMNRSAEFCEVFYDEVRIPLANIVGDVNDGWSVAMSTLSFERGTGFMDAIIHASRTVEHLVDEARVRTGPDGRRALIADDEYARRLGSLQVDVTVLRSATYRAVSRNIRQGAPGPEGSILKLAIGDLHQRIARLTVEMFGPDAIGFASSRRGDIGTGSWLGSFASNMGGGTSEIQRNIIAERVLGMPRG
jgi:alkylation response protein AidB-like acyl-CoA dehydrogenase